LVDNGVAKNDVFSKAENKGVEFSSRLFVSGF